MSDPVPPLSDDVRSLLEVEKAVPPAPDALRARALARAAVAFREQKNAPSPLLRRFPLLAAAALVVLVALGALAAYRTTRKSAPTDGARTVATAARSPSIGQLEPAPEPKTAGGNATAPLPEAKAPDPSPAARRAPLEDTSALELALLQRARGALAKGDDAAALAAIAEHQRRFPSGRLREEREALRVKALAGLGRNEEARRAAERFKLEFPRSVLSSSIEQTSRPPR